HDCYIHLYSTSDAPAAANMDDPPNGEARSGKSRRSSPCRAAAPAAALRLSLISRQDAGYSGPVESSLPRLRGLTVSARTFRRVALANVLWLFVIVSSGATVRLTGPG